LLKAANPKFFHSLKPLKSVKLAALFFWDDHIALKARQDKLTRQQ